MLINDPIFQNEDKAREYLEKTSADQAPVSEVLPRLDILPEATSAPF